MSACLRFNHQATNPVVQQKNFPEQPSAAQVAPRIDFGFTLAVCLVLCLMERGQVGRGISQRGPHP
jgi:hypothetical protein